MSKNYVQRVASLERDLVNVLALRRPIGNEDLIFFASRFVFQP